MNVAASPFSRLSALSLAIVAFATACAPSQPDPEVVMRHRWVTGLDREVLKYTCPEARRLVLAAEDPMEAAADWVRRGRQLEEWVAVPLETGGPTPPRLAADLDSLEAAVASIGENFARAVNVAASDDRECNGPFALRCDRRARAHNLLYLVDDRAVRTSFSSYQRHRNALAATFEEEGVPLDVFSCANRSIR